jgi:hypothetical protein
MPSSASLLVSALCVGASTYGVVKSFSSPNQLVFTAFPHDIPGTSLTAYDNIVPAICTVYSFPVKASSVCPSDLSGLSVRSL